MFMLSCCFFGVLSMTSCPIPRRCNLEIYIACLVNQFWPRLGILIFRQVTVPTSHCLEVKIHTGVIYIECTWYLENHLEQYIKHSF